MDVHTTMDRVEADAEEETLPPLRPGELKLRADRGPLIDLVRERVLTRDAEFGHYGAGLLGQSKGLVDYLCTVEDEPHRPHLIFPLLRWGGQFVYVSKDRGAVEEAAALFPQRGFDLVQGVKAIRQKVFGLNLPLLGRKLYCMAARKVALIQPRQISERFTYHVKLVPDERTGGKEYIVCKEVPTQERVVARLRARFPLVTLEVIEKRARKFTNKIFPLFLTREAAILKILQRDLPKAYRGRVPEVIDLERDDRGYVRLMRMNWLRNGGEPLTQTEFARQAADLLSMIHEQAGVIHLDLRLDNFVITEQGVGFVDFGSAVREDENVSSNPLLGTLFEELMRTSQIQRMLDKMTREGSVTSSVINNGYQKVDKAVDLFYLAVQISQPHGNPDLADLIRFNPESREAAALKDLTRQILKPDDPNRPMYRSAKDVFHGIERLLMRTQNDE